MLVDESGVAPASSTSARTLEDTDDVEPGCAEPEAVRAREEVGKECSVCHETKLESSFSRKQWAARAHKRRCSQCAGMVSNPGGVPGPAATSTALVAAGHDAAGAGMVSEVSRAGDAGRRFGLVWALLAAAVAVVSILLAGVWESGIRGRQGDSCSSHADCGAGLFCAIECFTRGCHQGVNVCQPCWECESPNDSVTRSCPCSRRRPPVST